MLEGSVPHPLPYEDTEKTASARMQPVADTDHKDSALLSLQHCKQHMAVACQSAHLRSPAAWKDWGAAKGRELFLL